MKKGECFRCALNGDEGVPATKMFRLFGENSEIPLCDACYEFWNRDLDEDFIELPRDEEY